MGFDIRVNNGRCPPFLLGLCALLGVVLICNWWTFSSQNNDLIRQIDILEEQMRLCCGERDQCSNDRNKLETNVGQLKIQIDQQKTESDNVIKRRDNALTLCKSELESLKNLDASKTESLNTLRTNLEEKKEKIKILNEQIKLLNAIKADVTLLKNRKATSLNEEKTLDEEQGNNVDDNADDTTKNLKDVDGERDIQMANNLN